MTYIELMVIENESMYCNIELFTYQIKVCTDSSYLEANKAGCMDFQTKIYFLCPY